jgi:hypothetical protein
MTYDLVGTVVWSIFFAVIIVGTLIHLWRISSEKGSSKIKNNQGGNLDG